MKTNICGMDLEIITDEEKEKYKEYSDYMASLYVNKVRSDQLSIFLEHYFKGNLTETEAKKALKKLCE